MAYPNGRVPASALVALPASWSNAGRTEYLEKGAAASLGRMLIRAVPSTGTNFQVYDAYRSFDEQVAMLKRYYTPVSRGRSKTTDRSYGGKTWAKKAGMPAAASPGYSNHGTGSAVDIHPSAIQEWIKKTGRSYGWTWDEGRRLGESWHFVYDPSLDRRKGEGVVDMVAIQRALGVDADGKFGTGTSAAVREWQKKHGLEADGIPGPDTQKRLLSANVPTPVPAPPAAAPPAPALPTTPAAPPAAAKNESGFAYTYPRTTWDPDGIGSKVHGFEHEVQGVYLHYPGAGRVELAGLTPDQVGARLLGYKRDHVKGNGWHDIAYSAAVDQSGLTYELRGLGMETGANGGRASNREAPAILLLVGDDETPSPELIAATNGLLAQVRAAFPTASYIRGHRESPDASTDCPGDRVQALISAGDTFTLDGSASVPVAAPAPIAPPPAAAVPKGTALMAALIAAPDFPLLRTAAHRCYYGPKSGPAESVSGLAANTLAPGDLSGGRSLGLQAWQTRMRERGYSLAADGKYGNETKKAALNLQKIAGLTQDGLIGPDTWYASYVVPVR